ncbi:MAG: DUF3293 domain-containing protein [Rhodobacteraceae bacterium]|nr:DUF3293 domain-containing protein [Paracoccaceae bacterium]MCF8515915.1 DUF3293 domain-containing protein [Paracoccaceae bacterium]MCF8520316.1 DUF3293 domain-containing protein [Paracoccaceae bacterium]
MENRDSTQTNEDDGFGKTELAPGLIAAYAATDFRVLAPEVFTLRIGVPSVDLMAIYDERSVASAGFITAWNPWSEETDHAINEQKQEALRLCLKEAGYDPRQGIGADPDGRWLGEESWFIPGILRDEAISLGKEFHQNAVVWAGKDAIPRLILLR